MNQTDTGAVTSISDKLCYYKKRKPFNYVSGISSSKVYKHICIALLNINT